MCTYNQLHSSLHQKDHGQQAEGGDSPTLCHFPETPAGVLNPALRTLQHEKDVNFLSKSNEEEEAMKIIRRLKHFSYEYKMRLSGLYILEKTRLWGDLIAGFQYVKMLQVRWRGIFNKVMQ